MGNEQGRAVSCNTKKHAREYFFLRHGYHPWEDSASSDFVEEMTPIKVGMLKKVGTKSNMAMPRQVAVWGNRVEYSQMGKQVFGFMPTYGAEISEVEGEPNQFRLRDGFNNSVVEHIFVAATPKERAIWVEAIAQVIKSSTPLKLKPPPAEGGGGGGGGDDDDDDDDAGGSTVGSRRGSGESGHGVEETFATDLPRGEIVELTRDQHRALRAALGNDTGGIVMRSMQLTPVDRPFYLDFDDHRVWLNDKLYGSDDGTAPGGDPEVGPHPASILYFMRTKRVDSPCARELERWKYS